MDEVMNENTNVQQLAAGVSRWRGDSRNSGAQLEIVKETLEDDAQRCRVANQQRQQNAIEYFRHKKEELAIAKGKIDESTRRVSDLKNGLDANSVIVEQLRQLDKGLTDELASVHQKLVEIQGKTIDERQKLDKLRQEYLVYQKQHEHSKEEYNHLIKSYSDRLGVKLETLDGVVKFIFTLIDEHEPNREFCCTVRLSKAPVVYEGIQCQPYLDVFPKLIGLLNGDTLELGGFMCLMRRHFKRWMER